MNTTLKKTVLKHALRNVEKFYHSGSRTHIFFQPNIGSLGVKGFGSFADEAYSNYSQNLTEVLSKLESNELSRALDLILDGPRGIEARREIQIRLPREIKQQLRTKANAEKMSLSDLVREMIDSSMPYTSANEELEQWEKKFESSFGSEKESEETTQTDNLESLSFRLSENRFEDIERVAERVNMKTAKFLTKIIANNAELNNPILACR